VLLLLKLNKNKQKQNQGFRNGDGENFCVQEHCTDKSTVEELAVEQQLTAKVPKLKLQ